MNQHIWCKPAAIILLLLNFTTAKSQSTFTMDYKALDRLTKDLNSYNILITTNEGADNYPQLRWSTRNFLSSERLYS